MFNHEYCGECIFCTSLCPECGSTEIRVKYNPTFEYDNDTEGIICVSRSDDHLELECYSCDEIIDTKYLMGDKRFLKLTRELNNLLGLPGMVTASLGEIVNGEIKINTTRRYFSEPSKKYNTNRACDK